MLVGKDNRSRPVFRRHRPLDDPVALIEEATSQIDLHDAVMDDVSEDVEMMWCKGALSEIFVVHFGNGATSYSEVFERLSEDEWVEVARILGSRKLVDVMSWQALKTSDDSKTPRMFSVPMDHYAARNEPRIVRATDPEPESPNSNITG